MSKRLHAHIVWSPEYEGTIKAWTINFINRNKWRCDHIHDTADLMQDAYLVYHKIVRRYPRVVEPQHFMSLYKTALGNYLHDQSRYMQRKHGVHEETSVEVTELFTSRIGELTNAGYLSAALAEAPEEVRMALEIIFTTPEALRTKPRTRQPRETMNMKLRRLLGMDKMLLDEHRCYDITGALKAILT